MIDDITFIKLALSFEETSELRHFEKTSFRVNKKIFATLHKIKLNASVKLSEIDQSVFCNFNPDKIYPATGTWGKQGWTVFEIQSLKVDLIKDALTLSYCNVAPKHLAAIYR